MRGVCPCLYIDYKQWVWRFFLNRNNELCYGIMYTNGKWTKDNLIDVNIIDFNLFIDGNEGIHLIYSNTKGELKYCTLKKKQWFGKVLYKIEDESYGIESIKVEMLGREMHIFFILASKIGNQHGVLMHCILDDNKISFNKLQDIILEDEVKEHYLIKIKDNKEIYLFYLSDMGDEISLNYSIYKINKWGDFSRLYGINGEYICFDVEIDGSKIHILNRYKENSLYTLDYIMIDYLGVYKYYNIYNSNIHIKDPFIFKESNNICVCWIEDNKIQYSKFNNIKWDKPLKFINENNDCLERYNTYISNIKKGTIDKCKLYGTTGLDLYLYYPKYFTVKENKNEKCNSEVKEYINEIKLLQNEIDILNKKISSLMEENKRIKTELEVEKQSVMERLLRRGKGGL